MTEEEGRRMVDAVANLPEPAREAEYNRVWSVLIDAGLAPEFCGLVQPIDWDELAKAKPFLNAGFDGPGFTPYGRLITGACAYGTSHMGNKRTNEAQATAAKHYWVRTTMDEARRRYREGFYADPFTDNPVRRPDTRKAA